jgi:signal peptidase I
VTEAEESAPVAATPARHEKGRSFARELPVLVLLALVMAMLIKVFLVQAFFIPSGSMEQTLQVGDRVLVNKVPYHFRGPERGEIVVFNGLDNFDEGVSLPQPSNPLVRFLRGVAGTIGLGPPSEKDYIKRVIGIGGDRVMCCDADGRVVLTAEGGQPTSLEERYVFENDTTDMRYFCAAGTGRVACPPGAPGVLVPKDRLWVMGDHRGNSSDSRFHLSDSHQGTVPEDKVVGRAFLVVFPLANSGLLRVPDTFANVALPAAPALGGLLVALPVGLVLRRRRLSRLG